MEYDVKHALLVAIKFAVENGFFPKICVYFWKWQTLLIDHKTRRFDYSFSEIKIIYICLFFKYNISWDINREYSNTGVN